MRLQSLRSVDVDVPGLAAVNDGRHDVAVLVLGIDQDRRARVVEIPNVMGDVLEVADIFAGIEIDRDERLRVEIVAGPDRAVEVRRRVADHEVDALGLEIDRRVLPHAAAERLVRIAGLGELRLLGLDIAMQVFARGVLGRPHADGVLGGGVEIPDELAGLGVIGSDEAADTVFATIRADQDFAVDGGRRHRLAIAERGIGDLGLPHDAARLGVQRDELGIERSQIDLVVIDGHAAVVRAAAIGRDRTHGVLVVPIFLARLGVERIDMVERRRDIHDPVDDDRRRLLGLLHLRLEDPGGVKLADIRRIDLLCPGNTGSGRNCRWYAGNSSRRWPQR